MRPTAACVLALVLVLAAAGVLGAGPGRAGSAVVQATSVADRPTAELPTAEVDPSDRGRQLAVLDHLGAVEVVRLRPTGFAPNRTGAVRQCRADVELRCGPPFPVRFDNDGAADIQYRVTASVDGDGGPWGCGGDDRCVVEVGDGDDVGYVDTSFGDRAPVDVGVEVLGGRRVHAGDVVRIRVSGTMPDGGTEVVLCQRLAAIPAACLALAPLPPGTASSGPEAVTVEVSGAAARRCDPGPCTLTIARNGQPVRADVVTLRVTAANVVHYTGRRLAAGLTVAVALLAVALGLWRGHDWSPPRAADGSAIDDAAFADLDAEVAAAEVATGP